MSEPATIQIEDHTPEFLALLKKRITLALDVVGQDVEDIASDNAPVDTGRLAGSITHIVNDGESAVYVGSNVEYAAYQELGTSVMTAANNGRGYLRPAIVDNKDREAALFVKAIKG
jgi:hypothetical protein